MSLSTLNSPPLIASLGGGAIYAFPKVLELAQTGAISFAVLKGTNFLAYAVQTVAVARPGRMDGEVAKAMEGENQSNKRNSKQESTKNISKESSVLLPGNGRTLVAPAGWAFAIWGPIFLGEAIFVVSQLFISETSNIAPMIRNISIPFSFAHLFQTLWTAAFRPKYKKNLQYISAGLLGATALSLSKAHAIYAPGSALDNTYTIGQYFLYLFPMSLHFGWTTAATLVNLNGALVANPDVSSKAIAFIGHSSVVVATALGVYVTNIRSAPVYGAVIAWALFAVRDGMIKRMDMLLKKNDASVKDSREYKDAKNQKLLSRIGGWICASASAFITVKSFQGK